MAGLQVTAMEFRAKVGEFIAFAMLGHATTITRHGRVVAVVVNPQEYERLLALEAQHAPVSRPD